MTIANEKSVGPLVLARDRLDDLFEVLRDEGYRILGPTVEDGAVVVAPLNKVESLPIGVHDIQDGGLYRLEASGDGEVFGFSLGPQSWKRRLYPPEQVLFEAQRTGPRLAIIEPEDQAPREAFVGVRPCELAALAIHDRVFDSGEFQDTGYHRRREAALIVAVNCGRPGGTCFCASMGTGPGAEGGYDLLLTEILHAGPHRFLIEAGSSRGRGLVERLAPHGATASDTDRSDARAVLGRAAAAMGRVMIADAAQVLRDHIEDLGEDTARRCLACGNCTMVCPTCFCSTVVDETSLDGATAVRKRLWDSCFTLDFTYIHGGSVRRRTGARYRQWIGHKLAHWHEQFGTSGCVGCGRCITWCPVGIDITEETRRLQGPTT